MPPHSVHDSSFAQHHNTNTAMSSTADVNNYADDQYHDHEDDQEYDDEPEYDDEQEQHDHLHPQQDDHVSDASMESDASRERRRRTYEDCQTDEDLFAQHNSNIQSMFDNRHHEIQFDRNDIQCAAAGGDDGSSIGGGYSLDDNSTQGSVRTREELRVALIARRRRLAQLENALDGEGSLDMSLKLNRSERDGDNSLMSSVSLNESITDSLIARVIGMRKKKKEIIKDAAEKKKSKDKKSSSKSKDRDADTEEGGKDKSDRKNESNREKAKKESKHSKRHKDKEKSHKSKKTEKRHDYDEKKSRRKNSRRHSNNSSEDASSSSGSDTDDEDEGYYSKRRSSQPRSASNIVDKSRAKQMMTMGGKSIQKIKGMVPTATHPPARTDHPQQHHHSVVYFACNEATGMCAFHPDVQLRKKSMFGGWNDVLKQCPKCASESYSRGGGGGGGQQHHHQSTAARRQMPGGGVRQSSDNRAGLGGGMHRSIPTETNRHGYAHPPATSDGRMRQHHPSSDQRGGGMMYRGQVHPQQSSSYRTPSDASHRQHQGQPSSKYPSAGGASSRPIPTSASRQQQQNTNQFYSSMHFHRPQDVGGDRASTSRRQSYPDVAHHGSANSNHLPQYYQHPTKPSNGRRANFQADPPTSSRPASNGMSYKVTNNTNNGNAPKRVSIGDVEEGPISHSHAKYTYGDEGRRRDMIVDTNVETALRRISNLKPGYPAFIKRSTGQWTYAKVKHISSEMIVFYVDAKGSSKAYNVKHWVSNIRTLTANQDGW